MAKFTFLQSSFSSGELSPFLNGRADLQNYFQGLDEMTNFIPLKQGGAQIRPGTNNILNMGDVTANDKGYALIPFVISPSESYLVVINRRTSDAALSITVLNPNGVSQTMSYTYTNIWNKYGTTSSSGIELEGIGERFGFQYAQQGDLLILVDTSGLRSPIVIFREPATAFAGASIFGFEHLTNPTALKSGTSYNLIGPNTARALRFPFQDPNINENVTFTPSATSGSVNITAKNAGGSATPFFTGEWIGQLIQITHASQTGIAIVTAVTSTSVLVATTLINFGATTASDNWRISAWGPQTGYPRSVTFFEGRLIFGGNNKFPDTIWASEVGDVFHFMQDRLIQDAASDASGLGYFGAVKDTDPFTFTIAQKDSSAITWLMGAEQLHVGTMSGEFAMTGGSDAILGVNAVFVKNISNHGGCPVQPIRLAGSTIFVSKDRKTIREIPANYSDYGYSIDLSILSDGIQTKQYQFTSPGVGGESSFPNGYGVCQLAWQENTSTIYIALRDYEEGTTDHSFFLPPISIIGLTYEKTSKLLAWWKYRSYAATSEANTTASAIYCLTVIPKASLSSRITRQIDDTLYLISGRDQTKVTLERSLPLYRGIKQSLSSSDDRDVLSIPTVMDACRYFYNLTPFTSVTFADYANLHVGVVANGNYIGIKQANGSGVINLGAAYNSAVIGFPYRAEIKTMPVEAGGTLGPSQGSERRIHEAIIRLHKSRGGSYQANSNNKYALIPSSLTSNTTLFTGERKVPINASTDDTQVSIIQNEPYPITVLWLALKGVTYDG